MPSREPELYKDKIEVSLDGRQIFYLFFGGAVIVGMVFVLGVMVGRRVEARGHLDRADPPASSDPLAALDRLERSDHLSFHGALTGSEAPTDVEKAIGDLEKRRAASRGDGPDKPGPARPEVRTETKPEAKPEARPEIKPEADKPRAEADKARSDKHDSDKRDGDKTDKKIRKHDDGGSGGSKPDRETRPDRDKKAGSRGEPVTRSEARADPRADGKAGATEARGEPAEPRQDGREPSADRVRFTLQLSSFQDRSEAEAFLSAIKSAGFQPYLTEADVTGKGMFYRVRLGSYRSLEAANDARTEYEKASRKTAQVMRL